MSAPAAAPQPGALTLVGLRARSRPYRALARATLRSVLAFRLQFALSLLSVLFQLAAMLAVWHALLSARTIPGFSWPQMEAYLLVGFGSGALVSTLADFRVAYRIRTGQVSLDLVKPIDYQSARLAEAAGSLVTELAGVCVVWGVMFGLGGLRITPPPAPYLALFALSFGLIALLKFSVIYLTGLLCFWTQNYVGLMWARLALTNVLSGAVVPLSLLPHWLGSTAQWLPFAGMSSTPGLILIGDATGWYAVRLVGVQLFWAVALWVVARLAWRGALRQLTIHGG